MFDTFSFQRQDRGGNLKKNSSFFQVRNLVTTRTTSRAAEKMLFFYFEGKGEKKRGHLCET